MSSVEATEAKPQTRAASYRWLILAACWASFTLTSIDRSTWGPASVFVGENLAVPIAGLGAFATAYYVGYVVTNVWSGFASDAFGGRIVLTISLLGAGVTMMLFGSVTSAAVGIAVQAVVGFFAGADYAAGIRLIVSWFKSKDLGLALGIFTTATSIGTAVANLVVPALITASGWRTSYLLFGAISVVLAIALFFTLRPGPLLAERRQMVKGSFKRDAVGLVRNSNLLLTCLGGFGAFWGLYGFVTWANALMIKGKGVSPVTAGLVVAIAAFAAIAAKPVIGWVCDRFFGGARKIPSIVLLAVFTALLMVFGALDTPTAFLWAAPFLGFAAYGWSPLLVSLVPRIVPGTVSGSASGVANGIWQLGSVSAPLVVGAVFAASHSFESAFLALAAGPVVGLVILFFVRERRAEQTVQSAEKETA
ncbi:MFS transporter [Sinomonas cellulolyticus]|uniref:MFS transporter n=1 Tax=Sinomonas cellulolyticus TaxID=2801916 RepID=A0ABS1K750_9MICC|nr:MULTISPECIES: MFS transporter [Sinomonas]MBL0707137.1 MFS transporter [Sinomonas cellulolyticus]GHG54917.1 MFS transporter [Sinomonas sp. KCTC 49339]